MPAEQEYHAETVDNFKRVEPLHTTAMSSAQTTTNSWATVTESKLSTGQRNTVLWLVEETGASNGIDARVVGFLEDASGSEAMSTLSASLPRIDR